MKCHAVMLTGLCWYLVQTRALPETILFWRASDCAASPMGLAFIMGEERRPSPLSLLSLSLLLRFLSCHVCVAILGVGGWFSLGVCVTGGRG